MVDLEVVALPSDRPDAPGEFRRRRIFATEDLRFGETRLGPGARSAWHHHGRRTLYGYVVSGQLTLVQGPAGRGTFESLPESSSGFSPAWCIRT